MFSQLMTLYLTPVLYTYVADLKKILCGGNHEFALEQVPVQVRAKGQW